MYGRIASLLGFRKRSPGETSRDDLFFDSGITVPTDGTSGYAIGCIFQHTDGGAGTALYINEGTATSSTFAAVAALSAAQEALLGATAGTVTASLAVIVDANKDAGDFRNLDAVNIDAGSDAVAGTIDVFPATTARGKFILSCDNQDAATNVTLKPAPMGQASVVSIPDPGAATANVMLTSAANNGVVVAATSAEIDYLAAVTAGTAAASKALVLDGTLDVTGINDLAMTGEVLLSGGAATPAVVQRFGITATEGLEVKVYEETMELTNAVFLDTNCVIPAGAVILSVQGNLETTITGDGTGDNLLARIGLGTSGGDEDAYAEFAALTLDTKADGIIDWAVSAGVTVAIFAMQADGATACSEKFTGGAGQDVRVRVVYLATNSLDNA